MIEDITILKLFINVKMHDNLTLLRINSSSNSWLYGLEISTIYAETLGKEKKISKPTTKDEALEEIHKYIRLGFLSANYIQIPSIKQCSPQDKI